MAFRRTTDKTFPAEVTVNVANEKGGYDKNTFKAIFAHCTTEELTELRALRNEDLVVRKMVGWELKDAETGEDVPFTADNLAALLLIPPTPMAIGVAFWEQVNGARAKN
jgi:hypothetical protein